MSNPSAVAPSPSPDPSAPDPPSTPVRRYGGQTRVAGTVVAKLAQAAAEEVHGVSHAAIVGAPNAFFLPGSTDASNGGSSRRELRVHLSAGFAYPVPVKATADELRRHVRERVTKLVGQPVTHVDVTVAELVPPGAHAGARKRVE